MDFGCTTLVGHVNNGGGYASVGQGLYVLPTQFGCEPKATL